MAGNWNDYAADPGITKSTLLEGLRGKEERAWQRLADLYGPLVYSWCRRAQCQPGDAADIVQEVFVSVGANIDRLRRDRPGDSFRGWLRTMTRNKVIDLRRRQQKGPVGQGGTDANHHMQQLVQAEESFDQATDSSRERAELLSRALEMVKSDFEASTWQAFWHSTVDGESTAEISQRLNMKPNAIRQARFRVMRRLREEFGDLLD